jgi:hypothetical protein
MVPVAVLLLTGTSWLAPIGRPSLVTTLLAVLMVLVVLLSVALLSELVDSVLVLLSLLQPASITREMVIADRKNRFITWCFCFSEKI